MTSVRLTITLSKKLRAKIKQLAQKEKRSMSNVVRILLNEALKQRKPSSTTEDPVEHQEA